ncbi:hypothetical protein RUND412_000146 [Rhizina undulata]
MSARLDIRPLLGLRPLLRLGSQQRWNSNSSQIRQQTPGKPEVSPHINFYKVFGRPLAKVFLLAVFTYQSFYWLWLKLEKSELERGKHEVISKLEAELNTLREQKAVEGK